MSWGKSAVAAGPFIYKWGQLVIRSMIWVRCLKIVVGRQRGYSRDEW